MFRFSVNDGRSNVRAFKPPCAVAVSLTLILCATILPAQAQTVAAKASPADPADSQASVPAIQYASALARYRPIQETPPVSWQQANEKANQAGGWRAYAREKAAADDRPAGTAAPASQASQVSKPAPAAKAHEGHAPR
ncbi:hypothetical protein [Roseateles sp.]|uniref:hypothetical protein n=1 Tax=Roseateles sp. TaxID=1971397 RepID=UPI004035E73A